MRYAVVGASQGTGLIITNELAAKGHYVRAISRTPPAASECIDPVSADVEQPESLQKALDGDFDAVFFTVDKTGGIGGHALFGNKEEIRAVTYHGCVNTIEAVKRLPSKPKFVLLSVLGHDKKAFLCSVLNTIKPGLRANVADREQALLSSGLPYVVLRAPKLDDEAGGKVGTSAVEAHQKLTGKMGISRADLALAMIKAADNAPANSIWDVMADDDGPVPDWLK